MFARSLAVFVLGALLGSTASCAAEGVADDDEAVASSTSELRATGGDEGIGGGFAPSNPNGELDGLGKPAIGGLRMPAPPKGQPRFDIGGALEPPPFSPFEKGCYVQELLINQPGSSQPSRIYVTVCS